MSSSVPLLALAVLLPIALLQMAQGQSAEEQLDQGQQPFASAIEMQRAIRASKQERSRSILPLFLGWNRNGNSASSVRENNKKPRQRYSSLYYFQPIAGRNFL